jgi:hypothetical protein
MNPLGPYVLREIADRTGDWCRDHTQGALNAIAHQVQPEFQRKARRNVRFRHKTCADRLLTAPQITEYLYMETGRHCTLLQRHLCMMTSKGAYPLDAYRKDPWLYIATPGQGPPWSFITPPAQNRQGFSLFTDLGGDSQYLDEFCGRLHQPDLIGTAFLGDPANLNHCDAVFRACASSPLQWAPAVCSKSASVVRQLVAAALVYVHAGEHFRKDMVQSVAGVIRFAVSSILQPHGRRLDGGFVPYWDFADKIRLEGATDSFLPTLLQHEQLLGCEHVLQQAIGLMQISPLAVAVAPTDGQQAQLHSDVHAQLVCFIQSISDHAADMGSNERVTDEQQQSPDDIAALESTFQFGVLLEGCDSSPQLAPRASGWIRVGPELDDAGIEGNAAVRLHADDSDEHIASNGAIAGPTIGVSPSL